MGIYKEVYAGYIEIEVDFDAHELVEHMIDAGATMEDVLMFLPDDAIDRGLREYVLGFGRDEINTYLFTRLEAIVEDGRKRIAERKEVNDG
jgi:hypothetical protein